MYALVEICGVVFEVQLSNGKIDWGRKAIEAVTSLGFLVASSGFLWMSLDLGKRAGPSAS